MKILVILLLALSWLGPGSLAGSSPETADLWWFDVSGEPLWSAPLARHDEDGGFSGQPILARPWFRPLPNVTFNRLDGGESTTTGDLAGDVVVLDFWASWCAPCRFELPRMEAFQDRNRDRGLTTLAVNLQEQPELATQSAKEFGLGLPIVEYGPEFSEAFAVRKIPTIIVADRLGRIRARWELFNEDVEQKIYNFIEGLLDPSDAAMEAIAQGPADGRVLGVRWMRDFDIPVDAVTAVAGGGGARVIAAVGRNIQVMRPEARTTELIPSPHSSGRLVVSEIDDEGGFSVLAYRIGGTRLSRFELPSTERVAWDVPSPLLDAVWVDVSDPGAGAVAATTKGLVHIGPDGEVGSRSGTGLVRGVAPASTGEGQVAWVALTGSDEGRQWRRFGADLHELDAHEVVADPWRLEGVGAGGYAVFSPLVRAAAVGRFFAGIDAEQIAVATAEELVVLESDSGAEVYRAQWPGIGTLAAADTDRNGLDELMVTWGTRLAVLEEVAERGIEP